jgi:hypothetical protein
MKDKQLGAPPVRQPVQMGLENSTAVTHALHIDFETVLFSYYLTE